MHSNINTCPCYEYEERVAIMIYDAKISEKDALELARKRICLGCNGRKKVDLFNR
jgi:hypothetical protein